MTAPLALLASYPPPYGGVANHVHRLSALLDDRGVEHVIYNAVSESGDGRRVITVARNRSRWMLQYALNAKERAIYIFSARLEAWVIGALMARTRKKRVIIRLRNVALFDYLKDPKRRLLASQALRSASLVIAVSKALAAAAREAGVPEDRILHQPGFLPPTLGKNSDAPAQEQLAFLASHGPIIAANGKVDWHDGVDLYGLDQMVEMMGRLKSAYPKLGLAVSFWDHMSEDEAPLQRLKSRARQLGVEQNILFFTQSRPFVPVLERADLFLRPTCTDGDANSVREALYLGVPAIASDVVERPEGTILTRTRDLEDLVSKTESALASLGPRVPRPSAVNMAGVDRYVEALRHLAND